MSTPAEELPIVDPAIAIVDPAVAPAADPQEPIVHKSAADLKRDVIYAKALARRSEAGDSSEEAMRKGVEALQHGEPQPAAEPATPAAENNSAPDPLAANSEVITLTVDGREICVPAADVWAKGVATLQKQTAADMRLQRAAQAEEALVARAAALERRAAQIEAQRLPAPAGAASPADTDLPAGGPAVSRASMREALDALLDSDTEKAAQTLNRVVAEQVNAGLKNAAPAPAPASPAASVNEIPAPWSADEINAANTVFATAFPDLLKDRATLARASARIVQEMANPINRLARVNLMVLASQVGREFTPIAPTPVSNLDVLAARRTLAARIPAIPATSSQRSVNQPVPSGPRPLSRSEQVQQMRKARQQA